MSSSDVAHVALRVARTVLWEGYALYPYRPSSLKNRRRILFGTLVPPSFADAQRSNDSHRASMDCLLASDGEPRVQAVVRFLRFGRVRTDASSTAVEHAFEVELPESITIDTELVAEQETRGDVCFPRLVVGLRVTTTRVAPSVLRVHTAIENLTVVSADVSRDDAELGSLGGAHVVLRATSGGWVSLLDPPAGLVAEAASCERNGLHPVLVGPRGTRDTVLGSAIILYDHPEVAPESKGDLFDATEIEEILSLRVQTLTADEREELKRGEPRLRALLERIDALAPSDLARLHGALRREPEIAVGDRVRIRPVGRADALDVLLAGMDATVVDIEITIDGGSLVCVTIDRDPGKDLGEAGFPGHRFMFRPDELERL